MTNDKVPAKASPVQHPCWYCGKETGRREKDWCCEDHKRSDCRCPCGAILPMGRAEFCRMDGKDFTCIQHAQETRRVPEGVPMAGWERDRRVPFGWGSWSPPNSGC